jgi:hypothetical protein
MLQSHETLSTGLHLNQRLRDFLPYATRLIKRARSETLEI